MTITGPDARSAAPGQAVVDAAMLVLERMGLTPADLLAAPAARPAAPTFAEYIPVVSALVSDGCRKAYGSYWNRVTEQWGSRCIDEPTPSEIRQLVQHVRASVVPRVMVFAAHLTWSSPSGQLSVIVLIARRSLSQLRRITCRSNGDSIRNPRAGTTRSARPAGTRLRHR